MRLGLESRVAMIAAGSKGLGLASALALASEGCAVSICARGPDALAQARAQLEKTGARVHATACDVSDAAQLAAWHDATAKALGPPDILVTNTGGPPAGRFLELGDDAWRGAISVPTC